MLLHTRGVCAAPCGPSTRPRCLPAASNYRRCGLFARAAFVPPPLYCRVYIKRYPPPLRRNLRALFGRSAGPAGRSASTTDISRFVLTIWLQRDLIAKAPLYVHQSISPSIRLSVCLSQGCIS
ncbi:hypothetical protein EVAR_23873_1 [Eumeta japonica]|uniref:Uncharacterized protein n=1 Tax=Eumeta variegata TaxID=151549 RepID=A0A4C1V4N1_EUMVA|nr:hypothetical protein EVAR_23873_1 [Eumeta japonica]